MKCRESRKSLTQERDPAALLVQYAKALAYFAGYKKAEIYPRTLILSWSIHIYPIWEILRSQEGFRSRWLRAQEEIHHGLAETEDLVIPTLGAP